MDKEIQDQISFHEGQLFIHNRKHLNTQGEPESLLWALQINLTLQIQSLHKWPK